MTEKQITQQQLHTENIKLDFKSNAKLCLQSWVHYGKIYVAVRSTIDVPQLFFSMLSQSYYVIIDRGLSAPLHGI